MLTYKVGCLIKAGKSNEVEAVAHCCNCFCTMGSGIAPLIAKAFPQAQDADNLTTKGSKDKLGSFTVGYSMAYDLLIYNLYGQFKYYPRTVRHLDYEALRESFKAMATSLRDRRVYSVGLPKLGAGLAGGDWNIIETIIEEELKDFEVTIYVLKESEIPK